MLKQCCHCIYCPGYEKFVAAIIVPLLCVALLAVSAALYLLTVKVLRKPLDLPQMKNAYLRTLLTIAITTQINVTSAALRFLQCVDVGDRQVVYSVCDVLETLLSTCFRSPAWTAEATNSKDI